jgi:signal transduction histidine kinase
MEHAAPTDTTAATATPGDAEPRANRLGATILTLIVVIPMLAYLSWALPQHSDKLSFSLLFFILAVAVVDLIPVPAWGGLQLSLSFPILLGVAMIYPAPVAAFAAVVGSFDPREFRREIPFLRALWNRCQVGLSFLAGGTVFHRIASLESPWTRVIPAILLTGVVAYTVNTLCVATYTAISRRISVGSVLARMHGTAPYEFLLSYLGLGLFGAVIARFYVSEGLWSVAVLLAPLIFARQMYFRSRLLADRLAEQNRVLADQARKLEELLEKEHHRVDELRELNRMKGEFVAVVSHELRTPVTALIGYAKTLREPEFAEDPAMRQEFLERMERQGERLLRLVENLLTASRIESRQLPVSVGRVLFEDLVSEVVEGLSVESERIKVDVPSDLPVLHTDRQLLGRVVSNLLDNALKYSPEGTPCEFEAHAEADSLVFWVQDHGIGISAGQLSRIFERFYQVDSSSTRTFRGAGLGLSLVKDLLDHLGGTIEVQSSPGQGSRFTVALPFRAPDPPLIPEEILQSEDLMASS